MIIGDSVFPNSKKAQVFTYATCIMNAEGDSGVSGVVKLVQAHGGKTKITAEL